MNLVNEVTYEAEDAASLRSPGRVGALPPGAMLAEMQDLCVGCGDCVAVCPSAVLELDVEGLPRFNTGQTCGVCGLCADVCSFGAIPFTRAMLIGLQRTLRTEREMAERLLER